MMFNGDLDLSLEGDVFAPLKKDFDKILERTLGNMTMRNAEDATISIKLSVSLDKMRIGDFTEYRDIIKPTFKHEISSVMQVKDKLTGQISEDYELVFDDALGKYVVRNYNDGQCSIFDGDYSEVEEEPEIRALPSPDDNEEDENTDKLSPFEWLKQYDGITLKVTETMGNYAVKTANNEIVLTSATDKNNPFFIPEENLKDHVGHDLVCISSKDEDGEINEMCIYCDTCDADIFSLKKEDNEEE